MTKEDEAVDAEINAISAAYDAPAYIVETWEVSNDGETWMDLPGPPIQYNSPHKYQRRKAPK